MINKEKDYIKILNEELIPVMGCTEPISVAYAAAKAREVLGKEPEKVLVQCSGNIIKNVKSVTIPNSGNLVGIEAATILGITGGNASRQLGVINEVDEEAIKRTHELIKRESYCKVELLKSDILLHIFITVFNGNDKVSVEIKHSHNNISKIIKNNDILFENVEEEGKYLGVLSDRSILNVTDIKEFADNIEIDKIKPLLEKQISYNIAIANEGLTGKYGLGIGKILLEKYPDNIITRIKAYAASGSEARMCGCTLPVVTNSGSGNQGMACSIPVIVYGREKGFSDEKIYRALAFSDLITIHQKTFIGRLSAFCGAISASCASGAAITYLEGGSLTQIKNTIINTLANISGVVCDGAKASCASKISSGLDAAIMAHHLAMNDRVYENGCGLVKEDVENTIITIGRLGKVGMKETDIEILNMMLGN